MVITKGFTVIDLELETFHLKGWKFRFSSSQDYGGKDLFDFIASFHFQEWWHEIHQRHGRRIFPTPRGPIFFAIFQVAKVKIQFLICSCFSASGILWNLRAYLNSTNLIAWCCSHLDWWCLALNHWSDVVFPITPLSIMNHGHPDAS